MVIQLDMYRHGVLGLRLTAKRALPPPVAPTEDRPEPAEGPTRSLCDVRCEVCDAWWLVDGVHWCPDCGAPWEVTCGR